MLPLEEVEELQAAAERAAEADRQRKKAQQLRRRVKDLKGELADQFQSRIDAIVAEYDEELNEARTAIERVTRHFQAERRAAEGLLAKLKDCEARLRDSQLKDGALSSG